MKRAILFSVLLFPALLMAQSDNEIHVKAFPGGDVGTMTANAMQSCPAASAGPCILIIDASLAAWPSGTMPALCQTCSVIDYRSGASGIVSGGAIGNIVNVAWPQTGIDYVNSFTCNFTASGSSGNNGNSVCGYDYALVYGSGSLTNGGHAVGRKSVVAQAGTGFVDKSIAEEGVCQDANANAGEWFLCMAHQAFLSAVASNDLVDFYAGYESDVGGATNGNPSNQGTIGQFADFYSAYNGVSYAGTMNGSQYFSFLDDDKFKTFLQAGPAYFASTVYVQTPSVAPTGTVLSCQGTCSVPGSTTYYFKIEAMDGSGLTTAPSPEGSATTTGANQQIVLTWPVSAGARQGYEIYVATASGAESTNCFVVNALSNQAAEASGYVGFAMTNTSYSTCGAIGTSNLTGSNITSGVGFGLSPSQAPQALVHVQNGRSTSSYLSPAPNLIIEDNGSSATTPNADFMTNAGHTVIWNDGHISTPAYFDQETPNGNSLFVADDVAGTHQSGYCFESAGVTKGCFIWTSASGFEYYDDVNSKVAIQVSPSGTVYMGEANPSNYNPSSGFLTVNNSAGLAAPYVRIGDSTYGAYESNNSSPCETSYGATSVNTGSVTTTTGQSCLPANAVIDAVVYRVTTSITTATSFTVGVSGSTSLFCSTRSGMTAGSTGVCDAQAANAAEIISTAAPVIVTFNTTPGAGALRIIVYYHTWNPPTS